MQRRVASALSFDDLSAQALASEIVHRKFGPSMPAGLLLLLLCLLRTMPLLLMFHVLIIMLQAGC